MGVDLCLIPVDCEMPGLSFGHSQLECERRRDLWPIIDALPKLPLPPRFACFRSKLPNHESGYGIVEQDAYGTAIQCVTAGEIAKIDTECVRDNPSNRAIWAYLRELPPERKIALFWH